MINSMTGFGKARGYIHPWGRVNLEMRSVNHRFLALVVHVPDGFLYLEQRLKEEISKRIKRGHVVCRLELNSHQFKKPILNKNLMKEYYLSLKQISRQLKLRQDININTLAELPGVWSIESRPSVSLSWNRVRPFVNEALDMLIQRRQQEGRALYHDFTLRTQRVDSLLTMIKARFKDIIKQRLSLYNTKEEKESFLKSSDINEEIVRLSFHIKNFIRCIKDKKAVGKELDFILQEMQREANTIGAKSIDAVISNKGIGLKSEVEKMREQVQNVE